MPRTITGRTKRMPLVSQRNKWLTINRPAHSQRNLNETERCSHGMDYKKAYGPINLNNKVFENVQTIQQEHKPLHECDEKLVRGIDSRRTNPNGGEN